MLRLSIYKSKHLAANGWDNRAVKIKETKMSTNALSGRLLGQKVESEYSLNWVVYAVVGLRIVMGWTLFQAGIVKLLDPAWTAAGFLQFAVPEGNPFMGLWQSWAGNPRMVHKL